jgi:hypothetical protein
LCDLVSCLGKLFHLSNDENCPPLLYLRLQSPELEEFRFLNRMPNLSRS